MTIHTHTSGPWVSHKYPTKGGYGFVIQAGNSRGISVANLVPGSTTDRIEPIAEANARLIASAPNLLSALARIESAAHYYGKIADLPDEIRDAFSFIVEEAGKAISVAK